MKECFKCRSEEVADHGNSIFTCKKCSAREAHGEPMPRIVVQLHDDRRFAVVTIMPPPEHDEASAQQVVVDLALAGMWGRALASLKP